MDIRITEDREHECLWIVVEDVCDILGLEWADLYFPHVGKKYYDGKLKAHVVDDTALVSVLVCIPGKEVRDFKERFIKEIRNPFYNEEV